MKSKTSRRFWNCFQQLPKNIQKTAKKNYALWLQDNHHPSIQFKKLRYSLPVWSARCGDNHRAVGIVKEDTIIWFFIGSHADYDALIKNLSNLPLPT